MIYNTIITSLLITIFSLPLARRYPVFFFYFSLALFFDPGGYLSHYFDGIFNFRDVTFILCFLPLLSTRINRNIIWQDKNFRILFKFLVIFQIYYIVVYGYLTPLYFGRNTLFQFAYRFRYDIFSIFIIFPAYAVAYHNVKVFYKLILYSALVVLSIYLYSFIGPELFIPIRIFERYKGSGMERITLESWGMFHFVLFLAIIVYITKIKVANKKALYLTSLMMFVTMLFTLTRRLYVFIAGFSIIIVFITSKLLRKSILSFGGRFILYLITFSLIFFLLFPQYFGFVRITLKDLYLLVTTGHNIEGRVDYRFAGTGGVAHLFNHIGERPFFGTGYYEKWYDSTNNFSFGQYKAQDNPYLGVFAMYGFVGMFFYLYFYVLLIRILLRIYSTIRREEKWTFIIDNYHKMIIIFLICYLVYKFSFGLPSLAIELIHYNDRIMFIAFIGILLALFRKFEIKRKKYHQKEIISSDS